MSVSLHDEPRDELDEEREAWVRSARCEEATTSVTEQRRDRFDEIVARHEAAMRGPYRWFGDTAESKRLYLATPDRGRQIVMDFVRWGFHGAQPRFQVNGLMHNAADLAETKPYGAREILGISHPDAEAIQHSWEDCEWLIQEVRRLRALVTERKEARAS